MLICFDIGVPSYRLRMLPRPHYSRMAAMFVLATSSSKALSRKTIVASPVGSSHLCQAAIPRTSKLISAWAMCSSSQVINIPASMKHTTLPSMSYPNRRFPPSRDARCRPKVSAQAVAFFYAVLSVLA